MYDRKNLPEEDTNPMECIQMTTPTVTRPVLVQNARTALEMAVFLRT